MARCADTKHSLAIVETLRMYRPAGLDYCSELHTLLQHQRWTTCKPHTNCVSFVIVTMAGRFIVDIGVRNMTAVHRVHCPVSIAPFIGKRRLHTFANLKTTKHPIIKCQGN